MDVQTLEENYEILDLQSFKTQDRQIIQNKDRIIDNLPKFNELTNNIIKSQDIKLSEETIKSMRQKGIGKIQYQSKLFKQSFNKIKIIGNKCEHPFILTYFVFIVGFKIRVSVKLVNFPNFCYNSKNIYVNQDSTGKYINTSNKEFSKQYIKIVEFKQLHMRYFTLKTMVKEVAITKLLDLFDIGPQYKKIQQFDILAYTNAACYKMQRWVSIKCVIPKVNPKQKIKQMKQNLKYKFEVLRNLNIVHKNISDQNIFYSFKKDKFILLDLSMISVLNNQHDNITKQNNGQNSLSMYYKTDQQLLEELINVITQKYETNKLKYFDLKKFYNYIFQEETKMNIKTFNEYYQLFIRQKFYLFTVFYGYGYQIYPIMNQYTTQHISYDTNLSKINKYLNKFPKQQLNSYSEELDNLELVLLQNDIFYPTLKLIEQKWMFEQIYSENNFYGSKKQLFQCFKYLGYFTLKIKKKDNMHEIFLKDIKQKFQAKLIIEFMDLFLIFFKISSSHFIKQQVDLLKGYRTYIQKYANEIQIVFFSQIIVIYLSCKTQPHAQSTNFKNFESYSEFVYSCIQTHCDLLKQKGILETEDGISFYINFIKFSSSFNTISINYLEKLINQANLLLSRLKANNQNFEQSIYHLNILMFQTTCIPYKYSNQQLQAMNNDAFRISQILFEKPNRVQRQICLNLSEIFYCFNKTDLAEEYRKIAYQQSISLMTHFEILQTLEDDELNLNPKLKEFFVLLKTMEHEEALKIVLQFDNIARFDKEQYAKKAKAQVLYINNAFGIKKPATKDTVLQFNNQI